MSDGRSVPLDTTGVRVVAVRPAHRFLGWGERVVEILTNITRVLPPVVRLTSSADSLLTGEGEEKAMRGHRLIRVAVKVALIGLIGSAAAAGPLSKQEVTTLITGSKVTQQDSDPSTSGSQLLEYDAGGKVTRQFLGKHRGFIETGTWEVNADGQLCVTWQGKAQPNCVYLVPTGRGGYNLTRDPAKTGKMEITGVSK